MIALKHILVATDFGEAADVALNYGRTLAASFGATLHLLHVTENVYARAFGSEAYVPMPPDLQEQIDAEARKRLDELALDSDSSGPTIKTALISSGSPALTIAQYAKDHRIDLIVMGTHGHGPLARLLMGSVAEKVVRIAPCPVLSVHSPEHEFVLPDALTATAKA